MIEGMLTYEARRGGSVSRRGDADAPWHWTYERPPYERLLRGDEDEDSA